MNIPVFLSYPRPHRRNQQEFIDLLCRKLDSVGLAPRTLGVTDYDPDAPLKAIRRLMLESYGLICVAFQRTKLIEACEREGANVAKAKEKNIKNKWISSPFCQIEPAMAYQLGLPILLFRQKGVIADGVLERGVVGLYMPQVSLRKEKGKAYLASREFKEILNKWVGRVRQVVETRGSPPALFK